jgi:hypothetical protein
VAAGEKQVSTRAHIGLERHTRVVPVFGTQARLIVLHEESTVAKRATDLAIAELRRVEEVLSLFRPDSAVCW